MNFDFDRLIDRRGTHSVKWDGLSARFGMDQPDAIPMWVADMDFAAPPSVSAALRELCDHQVHGYFGDDAAMKSAVIDWMTTRHAWTPEADWIGTTHGLVSAIGLAVQAYTQPGDGVVVFSPVYHMFGNTVRANGRRLIESRLVEVQGRYEMDLGALSATLGPDARMVLLCSPHNPGGRVWSQDELRALADFCIERDLILVSDEIHHDLVFEGATHHVMAKVAPDLADRLVTLTAPTKTFNIAGALTGNTIIADAALRDRFNGAKAAAGLAAANRFGVIALTAAYEGGAPWLDALLPYLKANRDSLDAATVRWPGIRSMHLEATYLAWLDFSGLGLTPEMVAAKVQNEARIAINAGPIFGAGGAGWLRFNFACPRSTLETAIGRLDDLFATG